MSWDNLKRQRFDGLVTQIEYYLSLEAQGCIFSEAQRAHIKELGDTVSAFGETGLLYSELCTELLLGSNPTEAIGEGR